MTMAVVALIGSIYISVRCHDWTWFARCGGLITLNGGVLATRRIIRLGVAQLFHDDHITDGGHFAPTPEEIESDKQDLLDIRAAKCAFCVIFVGTIICAFGDLLNRVFF